MKRGLILIAICTTLPAPILAQGTQYITYVDPTTQRDQTIELFGVQNVRCWPQCKTGDGIPALPSLTALPLPAQAKQQMTISFNNGPGNLRDWLALAPKGTVNPCLTGGSANSCTKSSYLNGLQTPPKKGIKSGQVTMFAPDVAGDYELHFMVNDTQSDLTYPVTISVK